VSSTKEISGVELESQSQGSQACQIRHVSRHASQQCLVWPSVHLSVSGPPSRFTMSITNSRIKTGEYVHTLPSTLRHPFRATPIPPHRLLSAYHIFLLTARRFIRHAVGQNKRAPFVTGSRLTNRGDFQGLGRRRMRRARGIGGNRFDA
jgi:hypothetical protein